MEIVDNPELVQLLATKEKRRQELAALPFPQKVAAVVKLQKMAAPILRAHGKLVEPWRLD
jgi:hypothetical protein